VRHVGALGRRVPLSFSPVYRVGMPDDPRFLLDVRCADLTGWWLHLDCPACGSRSVDLPSRLIEGRTPGLRLGDVLRGLRCRQCRGRPPRVMMVTNPADRAHGRPAPGGWRVEVTLPDPGYLGAM
jgi:hypothetical protein